MNDVVARRWWAMGALTLAILAISLDVTVLSVALPTLAGALKASESQLQWFVTAYTLVLAAAAAFVCEANWLNGRLGSTAATLFDATITPPSARICLSTVVLAAM